MSRFRNWCFTLPNYTDDEIQTLHRSVPSPFKYLLFGYETCPTTQTPHLQGYLQHTKQVRLTSLKKILPRAHWEPTKGSKQDNYIYCTKEGRFEEYGSAANEQGKRSDLDDFKVAVKSGTLNLKRLREDFSDVCAKYPRFVREYVDDNRVIEDVPSHPLRDWQAELNHDLLLPPDDRTITFVVDPKGNSGKTWFAKYYCSLHENAQYMAMAKNADMAYALNPDVRVLFINCTRQQTEFLNYSFLEAVKDGMVFSPKYESGMKRLGKTHVVVMMNVQPDITTLSEDRYNIIELA